MRSRALLRTVSIAVLLLATGLALALAVAPAQRAFALFSRPPLDASLGGAEIPSTPELERWLALRAARFAEQEVELRADSEDVLVTFAELGFSLDIAATAARVRALPVATDALSRWRRVWAGPPLVLREVQAVIAFERERAAQTLDRLAPTLKRSPEDARLDLAQHRRIWARDGRALDVSASLDAIAASARPSAVFTLSFTRSAPKIADDALPAVDVSQILGSYETSFRGRAGPREVNIRRAAKLLDGIVVAPGAPFSFNRSVGPRVEERGFVKAPVIVHDETEPGLGGGVCQVATTLHAAALFAGLEVTERRSHSRASGYAPLGLDATVIDGKVDLRLRNGFDTAVMIHAFVTATSSVKVEILGRAPAAKVEHAYRVVERHPFYRRVVEKPDLDAGSFELKQKGTYGYDIVSVVSSVGRDGSVARRRYKSKYYPVPEVIWVGPGTDPSLLPPLPDGALGLEPEAIN